MDINFEVYMLNYVGRNCLCNICFKLNKKNYFIDI